MTALRERWIAARNDLLGSPRFQRLAAKFPLTRPIARRRAGGLFDIVAGFVYSQVAFAVVETGLLPFLRTASRSIIDVARHTDLPPEGAERLLKAAASLGLAEAMGDRYALGSEGAALLGNPGVGEMILHHRFLYADLADPVALLRGTAGPRALAAYWPYAAADGERVAAYSALMATSQPMLADQILDAYDVRRHGRLLDIGGGEGVFLRAAAARAPNLALTLFDLPAVAARVADGRIEPVGGSFIDNQIPSGADLISLVRVLHDHDDPVVAALLAKVRMALPAGGRVLIAEPMARTRGAEPIGDAYFGFYLLAMGSGRPRTANELTALLRSAGFCRIRERRTAIPSLVRVLVAEV